MSFFNKELPPIVCLSGELNSEPMIVDKTTGDCKLVCVYAPATLNGAVGEIIQVSQDGVVWHDLRDYDILGSNPITSPPVGTAKVYEEFGAVGFYRFVFTTAPTADTFYKQTGHWES